MTNRESTLTTTTTPLKSYIIAPNMSSEKEDMKMRGGQGGIRIKVVNLCNEVTLEECYKVIKEHTYTHQDCSKVGFPEQEMNSFITSFFFLFG